MYKVYSDDRLIYNPLISSDGYEIFNPKLVSEVNKAESFSFKIYPENPEYDNLKRLKSVITIYDDGVLKFRGRILNDVKNWNLDRDITCEGELAFFNDSIVRPYNYLTGGISVTGYISFLINQHNAQVDESKQFTLRTVTVTDPNDLIFRGSSVYPTTLAEIEEKLVKSMGGYIRLERIDGVTYLDYLADSPYTATQRIELGSNLLDLKHTIKGEDIATAIIPLGAQITDATGQNTGERLKLANPDGSDYVMDAAAVANYGLIYKTVTYDDVTTQPYLLTKALSDLQTATKPVSTITLTAVDLSVINKAIDKLSIFEYIEAYSAPHELVGSFLVTKLELDMVNPENNKVSIGAAYTVLSDPSREVSAVKSYVESANVEQTRYVNNQLEVIKADISEGYVTTSALNSAVAGLNTSIAANATDITDLETFQAAINGAIAVDGSAVSIDGSLYVGSLSIAGDVPWTAIGSFVSYKRSRDTITIKYQSGAITATGNFELGVLPETLRPAIDLSYLAVSSDSSTAYNRNLALTHADGKLTILNAEAGYSYSGQLTYSL